MGMSDAVPCPRRMTTCRTAWTLFSKTSSSSTEKGEAKASLPFLAHALHVLDNTHKSQGVVGCIGAWLVQGWRGMVREGMARYDGGQDGRGWVWWDLCWVPQLPLPCFPPG